MDKTNLKELVQAAIKNAADTDEDKAKAAISAVSFWYYAQGYFNRSYELDAELSRSN
jgi:hypothetical protein